MYLALDGSIGTHSYFNRGNQIQSAYVSQFFLNQSDKRLLPHLGGNWYPVDFRSEPDVARCSFGTFELAGIAISVSLLELLKVLKPLL